MEVISQERVAEVIRIMSRDGVGVEEIESSVMELTGDSMVARRLIDWIPEAFGLVSLSRTKAIPPIYFQARDARGKFHSIRFEREPLVAITSDLARQLYGGPHYKDFEKIASRSSTMQCMVRFMEQGISLDGATSSGPVLLGIPAEIYVDTSRRSLWSRLFSR